MRIVVYGTPAPQGSKRHVGNGVMIESSKKVKPWRQDVKYAALQARGTNPPIDGPVSMIVTFVLQKPLSAPKRRRIAPCKKPDIDKLLRSTLDGLSEAGVWTDDARVISVVATKIYSEKGDGMAQGAIIEVHEVNMNS